MSTNGASGSQPARGVVVGRLHETDSDRIVVGTWTLYLCDGQRCTHAVGTLVHVIYTERDGRRVVDEVTTAQD